MSMVYRTLNDFGNVINIDEITLGLILETILVMVIAYVIKRISPYIIRFKNNKHKEYIYNRNFKLIISILMLVVIFFIWSEYIKDAMVLFTLVVTVVLFSIRSFIFDFFCGVYIKFVKLIEVENRIEIDEVKGDVIKTSLLGFEVLEIDDSVDNGLSTGVIVNFPNSVIFDKPLKNYNKAFKYVWNELRVNVTLDCDLVKCKKTLYTILGSNEVIRNIPKKMERQINQIDYDYRIYYNKYDPIIYTRVVEDKIELTLRYLIHPKKARYVESVIWNKILEAYKNNEIELYKKD